MGLGTRPLPTAAATASLAIAILGLKYSAYDAFAYNFHIKAEQFSFKKGFSAWKMQNIDKEPCFLMHFGPFSRNTSASGYYVGAFQVYQTFQNFQIAKVYQNFLI